MTWEGIMALQGEALNVAVAERVMGLRVVFVTEERCSVWIQPEREWVLPGEPYCVAEDGRPMFLPDYQGDLWAAWEAAEAAAGDDGSANLGRLFAVTGEFVGYWAEVNRVRAEDEDATDALCKAALLAAATTDVRPGKNGGGGR